MSEEQNENQKIFIFSSEPQPNFAIAKKCKVSEEQNEKTLDLLPPQLSETPLTMSIGMIFAMMRYVLRLENSSKKRSVFLRNDIGMI